MRLFDSHCHLQDDRIFPRIDEIISRALDAGVRSMLCCGSQESDWESVAALAKKYPGVIVPAFGIHPWYVKTCSESWLDNLAALLVKTPTASLGEIGLDHALDIRNDPEQEGVFIAQLELARELHRPVSIHCRKAWESMLRILRQHPLPKSGAIHSYSGPPDLVQGFEELGLSLSFSGSITYDRNKKGRASVAKVTDAHLLIETDAPDILPAGFERGDNEPANLITIAKKIAEIREMPIDEIRKITCRNAMHLFNNDRY